MEKFYNLIKDKYSFPIAATLVEDRYLYFVTYYNNILYKLDLETDEYEEILMPVGNKKEESFWHIINYNEKLLFVPYQETHFLEYDLAEKKFNIVLEGISNDGEQHRYRAIAIDENYLVLLDMTLCQILVLDLIKMYVERKIFLNQYIPSGTLLWMVLQEKYIYVFGKIGKKILKIDYTNGKVSAVRTKHDICYAEYDSGFIYYIPYPEYEPQIYRMNVRSGSITCLGNVELQKVKGVQGSRYWNAKKLNDEIFFFPLEGAEIVIYNLTHKSISKVTPYTDKHRSPLINYSKAIRTVIAYKNDYLLIPFGGNIIYRLNEKMKVEKEYVIKISEEIIEKHIFSKEDNEIYEGVACLEDFIRYIKEKG